MYLTYEEYIDMGGTLSKTAFNNVELDSEIIINWYTFDRLVSDTTYDPRVKACAYRLIELINIKHKLLTQIDSGEAPIKSQKNDGVDIHYETFTAPGLMVTADAEITKVIDRYLSTVKNSKGKLVLYRGLYEDE